MKRILNRCWSKTGLLVNILILMSVTLLSSCDKNTSGNITVVKTQRDHDKHPEVVIEPEENSKEVVIENKDIFQEITKSQEEKIYTEESSIPLSSLKNSSSTESYGITKNQVEIARSAIEILNMNKGHKKRPLRIVYFNPSDRNPINDFQNRISKIMLEIQAFYLEGMKNNGFGELTFDIERKGSGVNVHLVQSKQPKDYFSRDPKKADEIKNEVAEYFKKLNIYIDRETVIVFQNLARASSTSFYDTDAPYYGAWHTNMNRQGFCYVVDSEYLNWENLKRTDKNIKFNGERSMNIGELASGQIGGICHELGHSFCLNHTCGNNFQNNRLGTALMGYGNWTFKEELRNNGKGTYLSFASAAKLAGHPSFSPIKGAKTTFQLIDLSLNSMSSILEVNGRVKATPDVYSVIAYCDNLKNNTDYDASSWVGSIDTMGNFNLSINELEPSSNYKLTLQFLHTNGSQSVEKVDIRTNANGLPVLEKESREKILLKPILTAKLDNQTDKADSFSRSLTSGTNDKTIKFLTNTVKVMDSNPELAPSLVGDEVKSIYLSQVKWEKAYTGYSSPRNNRVHEDDRNSPWPFLTSGERIHRFGLYAHANSEYTYNLGEKWKKLAGKFSLKKDMKGSANFIISGDGKILFESGIVKNSKERKFSVNVSGVKVLKMTVNDAGDGKNSDWGQWLSPLLSR